MSYPKVTKLKLNQQITRDRYNRKCTICGSDTTLVHHIDGTKTNHELDNLTLLCYSCHTHTHNRMGTGTGYCNYAPQRPKSLQVSLNTRVEPDLMKRIKDQLETEKFIIPKRSLAQIVAEALEMYLQLTN